MEKKIIIMMEVLVFEIVNSYSTRLSSFSVMFITFTRAAARSDGVAFALHTVLLDKKPWMQSGYRKACTTVVGRHSQPATTNFIDLTKPMFS